MNNTATSTLNIRWPKIDAGLDDHSEVERLTAAMQARAEEVVAELPSKRQANKLLDVGLAEYDPKFAGLMGNMVELIVAEGEEDGNSIKKTEAQDRVSGFSDAATQAILKAPRVKKLLEGGHQRPGKIRRPRQGEPAEGDEFDYATVGDFIVGSSELNISWPLHAKIDDHPGKKRQLDEEDDGQPKNLGDWKALLTQEAEAVYDRLAGSERQAVMFLASGETLSQQSADYKKLTKSFSKFLHELTVGDKPVITYSEASDLARQYELAATEAVRERLWGQYKDTYNLPPLQPLHPIAVHPNTRETGLENS